MISNVVTVGDKIDIYTLGKDGEKKNSPVYVSQLLDFENKDLAKVAVPTVNGHLVPLQIDETYLFCFYTSRGLFQCNAVIIDRYKDGNLAILAVRFITEIVKYQRRQYYRLQCAIDIRCRLITKEEEILEQKLLGNHFRSEGEKASCVDEYNRLTSLWQSAVVTDISGGGARFNSNCHFKPEDRIKIDIAFEISRQFKQYQLNSRVISSEPVQNRTNIYDSRVEFSEITTSERETIIKFVFEEERKRRKREKGF